MAQTIQYGLVYDKKYQLRNDAILPIYEAYKKETADRNLCLVIQASDGTTTPYNVIDSTKGNEVMQVTSFVKRMKLPPKISEQVELLKNHIMSENQAKAKEIESAKEAQKLEIDKLSSHSLKTFKCDENLDIVEKVKKNNPIVTQARKYVKLSSHLGSYVGKSPFYNDTMYSFYVDESKEYFKDYGEQKDGDVVDLIAGIQKTTKEEALKFLVNENPSLYTDEEKAKVFVLENKMNEVNAETENFYKSHLEADNSKCLNYYTSRGFSRSTIEKFGLGYAGDNWSKLHKHLHNKGFSDEEMKLAGVISIKDNNRVYDFFNNRAMIPVKDEKGNVVSFGGRALNTDNVKYLNTADTPTFKKGSTLFNFENAKNSTQKSLIVVEGYMDCISAYESLFDNCVAGCGTAFTDEYVKKIKDTGKSVILAYDNDESGRKAFDETKAKFEAVGVKVERLDISEYQGVKDFNDILKKDGKFALSKFIASKHLNIDCFDKFTKADEETAKKIICGLKANGANFKCCKEKDNNFVIVTDSKYTPLINSYISPQQNNAQAMHR